jgi:carbon monoxide dehydrogenase subunit G
MKLDGEELIPAPREVVWKALNDPAVLKQCIPGCKSISKLSDTDMEATVTVALGPLKVNFSGKVKLSDLDPPNSYRISGTGNGGFAGSASGGADVKLETVPEGTRLTYDVNSQVTGKLASMGARLIEPVSRKLAGQFFEKFAAVAGAMKAEAPVAAVAPAKVPTAKKAPEKKAAAKKVAAKKPARKAAKKPAKKKR